MPIKADNTVKDSECIGLRAVLLSERECREIESELIADASTVPSTEKLAVLAKVRSTWGWAT
jgi:hypothetical protein